MSHFQTNIPCFIAECSPIIAETSPMIGDVSPIYCLFIADDRRTFGDASAKINFNYVKGSGGEVRWGGKGGGEKWGEGEEEKRILNMEL